MSNLTELNWLDSVPEKAIDWERYSETQLVFLKKPKFRSEILKKYVLSRMRKPFYRVNLDAVGTFVWLEIDGKKRVKEIACALENEFGDEVKPVEERLGLFLNSLAQNNFITYRQII